MPMTLDTENTPAPRKRGRPRKNKVAPPDVDIQSLDIGQEDESDLGDGSISDVNPYGWGTDSTPPGRVRFLRFYTWSPLPLRLVSLRDAQGHFLAPGYFAAVQATRSAGPVLATLRQNARRKGERLYVQQIFVPVVYPGVVPFRYWQHSTNPFDQTMVTLHYLHKKIAEDEIRRHFAQAIPNDKRFTIGTMARLLMDNRDVFKDFFTNPDNARCRGIIWRDSVELLLGDNLAHPGRIVTYAVLRPEWIVDAQPLDGARDLVGNARKEPFTCLKRLASRIITDDAAMERALLHERRRSDTRTKQAQSNTDETDMSNESDTQEDGE